MSPGAPDIFHPSLAGEKLSFCFFVFVFFFVFFFFGGGGVISLFDAAFAGGILTVHVSLPLSVYCRWANITVPI
jgi:hypothetical protein